MEDAQVHIAKSEDTGERWLLLSDIVEKAKISIHIYMEKAK